MTAFSRTEKKADWGSAIFELRSVNQRFLDLQFRLPEIFRHLEPKLRQKLQNKLSRGKVDCNLKFEISSSITPEITINPNLALSLSKNIDSLKQLTGLEGQVDWTRFLQWPDMVQFQAKDMTEAESEILKLFDQSIQELVDNRAREGDSLHQLIRSRLDDITEQVAKVNEQMPAIMTWQRERICQKFEEAKIKLDSERLEQELVLIAQKMDVAEELDRLNTHVTEFHRILESGGAIGRRMDFLLQELNREANTLGSKSVNSQTTAASVELKVLIEQIREQVQNIE